MGKPSKAVTDFMKEYSVGDDEIWEVHGSQWVVKHKALERIAAEKGIAWDRPAMIEHDAANKIAVICVFGKLGERSEWSIGEASPANNKNSYCYAMAEKRGKDRVILKLLNGHGALYSESEADEFAEAEQPKRQNPHVTRPTDIVPATEYGRHGEVIDNIPHAPTTSKLRVADQRPLFKQIQDEAHAFGDSKAFVAWMKDEKTIARVADFKPDWQAIFRGVCKEHLEALRTQEQQDEVRMAS